MSRRIIAQIQSASGQQALPIAHVVQMLDDQKRTLIDVAKRIEFRLKQVRTARVALVALVGEGYDFSGHPNDMAAVHGLLKRLVEYKEADAKESKNQAGKRYYWIGRGPLRIGPTGGRMIRDLIPQALAGPKRGGD